MDAYDAIAQQLPDIHRWVEARALLLKRACFLYGLQQQPELSVVLRASDNSAVFIVGTPSTDSIRTALRDMGEHGDILASCEWEHWLAQELPEWACSHVFVYHLPTMQRLPALSDSAVGYIDPAQLATMQLPSELAEELHRAAQHSRIAAAFVGSRAVAFSYAGAVTETLWDISIDTIEEYRRQGYAALAVSHLIHFMAAQGKQPVWAAAEENPASWRLAEKLGFECTDRVIMLYKEHTSD